MYIRSSNKEIIYSRTYQRLQNFFADVSAIFSQGMFILWFIISKVNENLSKKEIITKVMKDTNSEEYNLPKITHDYKLIRDVRKTS
jgi:hypothetical protein